MDEELKEMLQKHLRMLLELSKKTADIDDLRCLTQAIVDVAKVLEPSRQNPS